ncbi:MAG: hypothetical protein ACF8TS_10085 [Maioricimonas sp. JB049]
MPDGLTFLLNHAESSQCGLDDRDRSGNPGSYGHRLAEIAPCDAHVLSCDTLLKRPPQPAIDVGVNAQHLTTGARRNGFRPVDMPAAVNAGRVVKQGV